MKVFDIEDGVIKVGRNAKENWQLLDQASNTDWWFHLESFPSPHVFIDKENPSKSEIYQAAGYCKEYSKYKNYHTIYITYTQVKNIFKGFKEGEVLSFRTQRLSL
jgi:predicted ribosome quality control (RQC) complex YloA/Tae2 family protein